MKYLYSKIISMGFFLLIFCQTIDSTGNYISARKLTLHSMTEKDHLFPLLNGFCNYLSFPVTS